MWNDVSFTPQLKYPFTFSAQDGAEPSANSTSVGNLIRLSSFVDQKSYITKAEEIIKASVTLLSKIPLALPELVSNYIMYLQPRKQVNILVKFLCVPQPLRENKQMTWSVGKRKWPGRGWDDRVSFLNQSQGKVK